jgi:hypothetical protein
MFAQIIGVAPEWGLPILVGLMSGVLASFTYRLGLWVGRRR